MNAGKMKKINFKNMFVILLISLPIMVADVQAEVIKTYSSAINKAGRQRMLTQRIVKAYSMVGLDVQIDKANEQLLTSVELFERQLSELKRFSKNKATKESLAKVESLWQPFKNVALGEISKKGIEKLIAKDEALLKAAHQVVLVLQKSANSNLGKIVNMSGRQRMLSQRIAKFYMLAAWNIEKDKSSKQMLKASDEFSIALNQLANSKINTTKVNDALDDVRTQWGVFERSFRISTGNYVPLLIAMSSEKILVKMNSVTSLYSKQGK